MRAALVCIVVPLGLLLAPAGASAQAGPDDRPIRRVEVSAGAGLLGGATLDAADASLRGNSVDPQPYRLFATEARWRPAASLEARAGFALSRRYSVEGTFAFSRPDLEISISSDAEGAPSVDIAERVDLYLVDAALIVSLDALRFGAFLPVVSGGAGYARLLHEGLTLIENGQFVQAGVGVRRWLGATGPFRAAGIRADARLLVFTGDVALDRGATPRAALSASLFVVF